MALLLFHKVLTVAEQSLQGGSSLCLYVPTLQCNISSLQNQPILRSVHQWFMSQQCWIEGRDTDTNQRQTNWLEKSPTARASAEKKGQKAQGTGPKALAGDLRDCCPVSR